MNLMPGKVRVEIEQGGQTTVYVGFLREIRIEMDQAEITGWADFSSKFIPTAMNAVLDVAGWEEECSFESDADQ